MTREEAISLLSQVNHILVNSNSWLENTHEPLNIAFNMAIKALEQEPCEDAISRQAALDIYDDYNVAVENGELEAYRKHRKRLLKLPSAQPKTGHWIPTYGNVECSVCGRVKDSREVGKATHYCDFCGAKMVEPQESEE